MNNHAYAKHNIPNGRVSYRVVTRVATRPQSYLDSQIAVCKDELLQDGILDEDIVTGVASLAIATGWVKDYDIASTPAMVSWEASMKATDSSMPRWFEDYITENSVTLAPGKSKESYDAKVALRAGRPE